jgi:hypothetical protein
MQSYTSVANRRIYKLMDEIPAMMAAATTLEEKLRVGELAAKLRGSIPKKTRRAKSKEEKPEKNGFA